jgi:hypothetical protein
MQWSYSHRNIVLLDTLNRNSQECNMESGNNAGCLKKRALQLWKPYKCIQRKFEVTLRLTVSQSLCLGIERPCGTCDKTLLPVGMLLSEICVLVSVGCPLWWEDGSAICSIITQWSESYRTRNRSLLSHLRLAQPGGPGSLTYIPQEHGGPVIPPGTGF